MRRASLRTFALALVAVTAAALAASPAATAAAFGSRAGGKLIAPGRTAPAAVTDGAGGVIVSSRDATDGVAVVNRYDALGSPVWDQGIEFPDASGIQLAADGSGGAIVAVHHPDSAVMTVGRILHSGATTWQARFPSGALVAGGDGGAWIVSQSGEIFADGVDAAGALRPRLQVTTSPDAESLPVAIGDGAGGAYLAWRAALSETQFALRLQHLTAAGALWAAPAEVAGSSDSSITPRLAPDGRGGVVVSWDAAGLVWVHDYSSDGIPVWDQVVTIPATEGTVSAVGASGGEVFVAWTRRLRTLPSPTDVLNVSFVASTGAMHWTRHVAVVDNGVRGLTIDAAVGAAVVAWEHAAIPFAGAALDPDLSIYRVTSGGEETYPAHRRPLADSFGPESLGALVAAGGGSVVAVFTQTPCFRGDVSGVAMQRIAAGGERSFRADGACP